MGVGEERLISADEDEGDDLDEIEEVEAAAWLLDDEDEDIDEEEAPIILPRLDEDPVLLTKLLPLIGGTDFPTYMGVGAAELRGGKCKRGDLPLVCGRAAVDRKCRNSKRNTDVRCWYNLPIGSHWVRWFSTNLVKVPTDTYKQLSYIGFIAEINLPRQISL